MDSRTRGSTQMPHQIPATAKTPALIIYLLDVSGSMDDGLDGERRIDHVNRALNGVLTQMVFRSTKGVVVSPRYRIALIAYSDTPIDILGGVQGVDVIAQRGSPTLKSLRTTDTYAAFVKAREILRQELPAMGGCPAPLVCHMTDGLHSGHDPEPIAREIMEMKSGDGNVLLQNIYVGSKLTQTPIADPTGWPGLRNESETANPYAARLFRMSSELPESYASMMADEGYALEAGTRMLYPAESGQLVQLAFSVSGATMTT
jgi:von Willebrand factor type A domain